MKHTSIILLLAVLFSCSTTGKLTDEVFKSTLTGKSEMEIYSRLGKPEQIVPLADGGKEMIYEFYGRDVKVLLLSSIHLLINQITENKTGAIRVLLHRRIIRPTTEM